MKDALSERPFQIHLSTTIGLTFLAGLLLWMNIAIARSHFEPDAKTPWDEVEAINQIGIPLILVVSIPLSIALFVFVLMMCGREKITTAPTPSPIPPPS